MQLAGRHFLQGRPQIVFWDVEGGEETNHPSRGTVDENAGFQRRRGDRCGEIEDEQHQSDQKSPAAHRLDPLWVLVAHAYWRIAAEPGSAILRR